MKFKKGDIVRFKDKNSQNAIYFEKGLSGLEIHGFDDAQYDYRVYESDKSISWGVFEHEIELDPNPKKDLNQELKDYFGTKRIAIHTPTQEELNEVLRQEERRGNNWWGNKPMSKVNQLWELERENTCINICENLCYCRKQWYIDEGYKVISFKEYMKFRGQNKTKQMEENKMELKNINKKHLDKAKAKVEEEKMNAEIEFAVGEYRRMIDNLDRLNREKKKIEEEIKEQEDELKVFKGKN